MMESITGRVDRLEDLMAGLIEQSRITQQQIAETNARIEGYIESTQQQIAETNARIEGYIESTQQQIDRLSIEMKAFKDEMKVFKDEMKVFKDEMKVFKDEMKVFKDEMLDFKEWSKRNIEDLNRQWGNLANKMGTLVEDIFLPSFDIVLKKYFDVIPDRIASKVKIRKNGKVIELDILAYAKDRIFIVEVKSSPDRGQNIEEFMEKLRVLPEFLPEIKGYKLVPIYAGLSMEETTISTLTKRNIYAMIVKGDILEIVNFDKVKS